MKHFGDITKIHGWEVPIVDVVTGGSPCQDLSVAGKRSGLAGERSGLFMEQIRVVKEMREHDAKTNEHLGVYVRPRYMVWENVTGALSSNGGEDFRAVLEETARIAEEGVSIPGLAKGEKWANAGAICGDGWSVAWRVHDSQWWGVPQRRKRICVLADFNGHSAAELLFERFRETGTDGGYEVKRFFGNNDTVGNDVKPESLPRYSSESGNQGEEATGIVGDGVENSRNSGKPITYFSFGRSDQYALSDVASTQSHRQYKSPTDLCVTYGLDRASFNQGKNAKYDFSIEEELSQTLVAKGPGGVFTGRPEMVVRRLSCLECERLQGFPDGWTDIGEWIDSDGKVHKDAVTPRYKALGNSIALPFWRELAKSICGMYVEPVEMASLFDGIGGFPLVFRECGGIPVWASEIEEFPMAVTKIRFPEGE